MSKPNAAEKQKQSKKKSETWSTREKGWITEVFLSVTYSSQRKNPKEKLVSSVASLFKTPCSLLSYCAPKKKSYFNYVFWRISKNASKFTCPIILCRFRKVSLFECKFNQFGTLINLKNHSFFSIQKWATLALFIKLLWETQCSIWRKNTHLVLFSAIEGATIAV